MQKRDVYVDVAKGICMLLIMGIHTEAYVSIGMPFTFVAVPMFFFMSGMYDKADEKLSALLKKLFRTLCVPTVVWLFLGWLFLLCMQSMRINSGGVDIGFDIYIPSKYNGPVWFLFALFYVKLCMWGLLKLNCSMIILGGISVCMGYLGATYQMPMLIDEGLSAMPFYCAGKFSYPYLKMIMKNKWFVLIGVLSFLFFTYGFLVLTINPMGNRLYNYGYIIPMLCMLLVFIPMLTLSNSLRKVSFLQKFGQNTMGVLVVHLPLCMIMARIAWRIYDRGTIGWYILSGVFYVMIVLTSYYLAVLIRKSCPMLLGMERR